MSERFQRLEALKAQIAELSGLSIDSDAVIIPAAYKLKYEILIEDLVAGRNVNATELLNLGQAIREVMPLPQHKLEINIVGPTKTKCPKCAHIFDPEAPHRTVMLESSTSAESVPAPQPPAPKPSLPAIPASAPPAPNVVQLKPSRSTDGALLKSVT